MRISENYSYPPSSGIRAAVPAPAREVLNSRVESQEVDSVSGVASGAAEARASRVAELQQSVQSGTYKIDAAEVSASIIDKHLDS